MSSFPPSPGAPVTCELLNKQVKVSPDMAIFITMIPSYAGCSNLPDNLKKLFRSLAMTKPDRQLIAQVMLYSQGFRTAEILAKKIVPFFKYVLYSTRPGLEARGVGGLISFLLHISNNI